MGWTKGLPTITTHAGFGASKQRYVVWKLGGPCRLAFFALRSLESCNSPRIPTALGFVQKSPKWQFLRSNDDHEILGYHIFRHNQSHSRHNLVTYTVSEDYTKPGRRAFFCRHPKRAVTSNWFHLHLQLRLDQNTSGVWGVVQAQMEATAFWSLARPYINSFSFWQNFSSILWFGNNDEIAVAPWNWRSLLDDPTAKALW